MILSNDPGKIEYDDIPQIPVWHGKNNGTDCIYFYAPGVIEWRRDQTGQYLEHQINHYASQGFFFLSEHPTTPKNIEILSETAGQATANISSFDDYGLHELEQYNLLHSGNQWFGDKFTFGSNRNYPFPLINKEPDTNISIRIKAAARSSVNSEMTVSAGSTSLGKLEFNRVNTSDNTGLYASEATSRFLTPVSSENLVIGLQYMGNGANPEAWLDYIELTYRRKLIAGNNALIFRDLKSVGPGNILEFNIQTSTSDLKVWAISNAFDVKEVPLTHSGNTAKGKQPASQLQEYIAFYPNGNFPEPDLIGEVENQNLHGLNTPEFLIITHPEFLKQANDLADFHRMYDGMSVEVVPANKVYNEFSSGIKSVAGIRNFIKMFYDRGEGLKYVLLFGDGSYDNKGNKSGVSGLIPTFQSDNSLNPVMSFVTDDYFVLLDAGESVFLGAIDLGIGRIPASTNFEAELAVRKIRNYHSADALGNWRNILCFIGDDGDGNLHM